MNFFKLGNACISIVKNAYPRKNSSIFLMLAVVVGIIVRIVKAIITPIWRDEIHLILTARDNSLINLLLQAHWDTTHPPFFYIITKYWQKLDMSIVSLRTPSVFMSCLVLLLLPILANKISRSNKTFPISLVFYFSLIHSQIFLSIIVRPYSFIVLLSVLSLVFFFDLLDQSNKKPFSKYFFFILTTSMTLYVDYSAVWLIATYWIFLVVFWFANMKHANNNAPRFITCMMIISILCIPSVFGIIFHMKNTLINLNTYWKYFSYGNPLLNNLYVLNFFTGTTTRDFLLLTKNQLLILSSLKLFLSFLGIYFLKKVNFYGSIALIMMMIVPVIISFLFSILISPIFVAHNLFIVNIAMILGMSYLTSIIFNKKNVLGYVIMVIWGLGFISAFSPALNYGDPPYNWSQLTNMISQGGTRKTKILISQDPNYIFVALKYYDLLWRLNLRYRVISIDQSKTYRFNNSKEDIYFVQTRRFYNIENNIGDYIIVGNRLGCKIKNEDAGRYIYLSRCIRN